MIHSYLRLLDDDDDLMRGLRQHDDGVAAWRAHIVPRHAADWKLSERMVLYETRKRSYTANTEFTVDYGPSYYRDYDTGFRRRSGSNHLQMPVLLAVRLTAA